jgi:hypothetical protein
MKSIEFVNLSISAVLKVLMSFFFNQPSAFSIDGAASYYYENTP